MTQVLRFRDVERITGMSRATIYRRIQSGELPAPGKLGENSHIVGFAADAIERFVQKRLGLVGAESPDIQPAA